jgi:hypothetical protein
MQRYFTEMNGVLFLEQEMVRKKCVANCRAHRS